MEKNLIYNEDCIETLKRLDDNSVNLIVTSPPYNMNLRIRNGEYTSRQIVREISTKYEGFSDNLPIDEYYEFHSKVLSELIRVGGTIFYVIQVVTGSKRAFFKIIGEYSDYLKEIIVWDKMNGQPAMQHQVLNRRTELILVFEKDYPISRQFRSNGGFSRGTLDDIWQVKRSKVKFKEKYHGATFPEELVEIIIQNFTKEGDLVYDPFMGTGTTALVAKKMKRNYIGSEISKEYFNLASERLNNFKNG
jgi:site-specific DNA-methyltransferase (adenine-specific)/modification methylase